jgi:hypothetical protein
MAHMPARVTRAFHAEASGDLGLSGLGDTVNIAEKKTALRRSSDDE